MIHLRREQAITIPQGAAPGRPTVQHQRDRAELLISVGAGHTGHCGPAALPVGLRFPCRTHLTLIAYCDHNSVSVTVGPALKSQTVVMIWMDSTSIYKT